MLGDLVGQRRHALADAVVVGDDLVHRRLVQPRLEDEVVAGLGRRRGPRPSGRPSGTARAARGRGRWRRPAAPSASRCCQRADAERNWRTRSSISASRVMIRSRLGRRAERPPLGLDRQGDVVGEVGEAPAGVGQRAPARRLPDPRVQGVEQRRRTRTRPRAPGRPGRGRRGGAPTTRRAAATSSRPSASRWARLRATIDAAAVLQVELRHHADHRRAARLGGRRGRPARARSAPACSR